MERRVVAQQDYQGRWKMVDGRVGEVEEVKSEESRLMLIGEM
jgi:hypothetical protein